MHQNRIFLDCGRFNGVAIQQYCADDTWDIRSWDPDPMKDLDLPLHKFEKSAVWVEDTTLFFSIDPQHQASHIKDLAGSPYKKVVAVPAFDFSEYVAHLPAAEIVCSMDIEGAEFPVLRKMIIDGTIGKLKMLDVEFHHRIMNGEEPRTALELIHEIERRGVLIRLKVPL